jgi:hypothetical protein
MPLTFVLDMPGITGEQLDALDERIGVGAGRAPAGQLVHIEALSPDGARVIDVWESQEAYDRFMAERAGPVMAAAGLPPVAPPRMLTVHRVFVSPTAPGAR